MTYQMILQKIKEELKDNNPIEQKIDINADLKNEENITEKKEEPPKIETEEKIEENKLIETNTENKEDKNNQEKKEDKIESKIEQIENKDMFLTSSLGFRVNADPKAKRNMDTLIELQVQTFRDYDNVIHTDITVQDLETIKREISLNAVNLYNQKWAMESEINSLETIEDIKNYEIKFEMLNFAK